MQNFCSLPANHKCTICEFPPCNCEKCTKLRSEGKPDQDERKQYVRSTNDTNLPQSDADQNNKTSLEEATNKTRKFIRGTLLELRNLSLPSFNFTPSNLESVLFDLVGIISFFIMATIMFWLTISQYLWHFIKLIVQSGRRPQLISLILLSLLCVSITFHAIKGRHNRQIVLKSSSDVVLPQNSTNNSQPSKCSHLKCCHHKKCSNFNLQNGNKNSKGSKENLLNPNNGSSKQCDKCTGKLLKQSTSSNSISSKQQNPSLCDLCAKKMKAEHKFQTILSDDDAREIYKRFKFYAIPMEMKTPPSFSNLVEFVTGFYNSISHSLIR